MSDCCCGFAHLTTVARNLRCDEAAVARQFVGHVVTCPGCGWPAIPARLSREHAAKVNAEARQIHAAALNLAAEQARQGHPARQRVQAIRAQQDALGDPLDGAALATLTAADADERLTQAARDRAELLGQVEPQYHRIGD